MAAVLREGHHPFPDRLEKDAQNNLLNEPISWLERMVASCSGPGRPC